jgi:phenylacetate-coenzyme A ligase PaaK-like adenylate-forming protein
VGGNTFRRAIATTAWHLHPAPRGRAYRFLQRSQWLSRDELEHLQLTALNGVLAAAREIPFHRERLEAASIGPEGVHSLEELAALPPLERSDAQRLGVAGLRRPGGFVIRRRTSGSTGQPVEVVWPLEMMAWVDAAERRSKEWLGIRLGDRRLIVRAVPPGSRPLRRFRSALGNTMRVVPAGLTDPRYREAVLARLERNLPVAVIGNSKSVDTLALAMEGRPIEAKLVVTSAGRLDEHYRRVIGEAFNCPVVERYGTIETGLLSHPCREGGRQHVPGEVVHLEIVRDDGSPAPAGEVGHVLVTCLRNRTMPLIRYRLGDLAALSDTTCSCVRVLPVIERIVGRTNELLVSAAGGVVLPHLVIDKLMAIAGTSLLEFKIVQQKDLRLEVLVVQRDDPDPDACRRRLAEAFDELIGLPGGTVVKRLQDIPAERAEKLRVIVSHALEPDGRAGSG